MLQSLLLVAGQQAVEQDGHEGSRHDAALTADELDELGGVGEDLGVCTHAVATPSATETMVRVRGVIFSLVMSWMPDTTMEENIMTAAPPRTAWGMMEMSAPSLGMSRRASGRWHRWPVRPG